MGFKQNAPGCCNCVPPTPSTGNCGSCLSYLGTNGIPLYLSDTGNGVSGLLLTYVPARNSFTGCVSQTPSVGNMCNLNSAGDGFFVPCYTCLGPSATALAYTVFCDGTAYKVGHAFVQTEPVNICQPPPPSCSGCSYDYGTCDVDSDGEAVVIFPPRPSGYHGPWYAASTGGTGKGKAMFGPLTLTPSGADCDALVLTYTSGGRTVTVTT